MFIKNKFLLLILGAATFHFLACRHENNTSNTQSNSENSKDTFPHQVVLAGLQELVEKELTIGVLLQSTYFKANDTSAFISATILKKDGSEMDFRETPFFEQANMGGSFSDAVFGLLKKEGAAWKVKAISVGATDIPFICWPKAYRVSPSIFPDGFVSDNCEDSSPFIFLSNEGRLSLNGGINISQSELKEQLIEMLLNMDKIPDEITPEFGDKVIAENRTALNKTVTEAIIKAKEEKK